MLEGEFNEPRSLGRYDPNNIADHADFYVVTGLHLDYVVEGFRKHKANSDWFLQRFDEIMEKYKGQHIFIADEQLYSIENKDIEGYQAFLDKLRGQGVDLDSSFSWYVPKDDDPEDIKKYWIYPPKFVSIDEAASYLEENKDQNEHTNR